MVFALIWNEARFRHFKILCEIELLSSAQLISTYVKSKMVSTLPGAGQKWEKTTLLISRESVLTSFLGKVCKSRYSKAFQNSICCNWG
ncbi:unnamed protein product [Caretta caretta]